MLKFGFLLTISNLLNKRFYICKDKSISNVSMIDASPILKNKIIPINIWNEDLKNFCITLKKEMPNYDFTYMNKNLDTLKINYTSKLTAGRDKAYYNCVSNMVKCRKDVKDKALHHELLHMSSTTKIDGDCSIYSGFSQSTKRGNYKLIGKGLNEGYTQLLTQRYFKVKCKSYPIEVFIASKLENVITKEKMQRIYFNADLKKLVCELLKYSDEESIILFLYSIDCFETLYKKNNINKKVSSLKKVYDYLVEFLINIKMNKIMGTEINFKVAKKELTEYIKSFEFKIINTKQNKEFYLLDKYCIEEKIEKYINKLRNYYVFNENALKKHI